MVLIKSGLLCATLILILTGCGAHNTTFRTASCNGKSFNHLLEATELKPLFNDMALELCSESHSSDNAPDAKDRKNNPFGYLPSSEKNAYALLVTDFVDIQSFAPASQGLLMGELMRGSLSSVCGTKITQAEFAKFFNLNANGLVVLSRKVSEIKKDEYDQNEAVVGTYSYLNNKIILFVRKINVVTGKISKMATRELNYNCVGNGVSYSTR
jgi:hypothetical protein